MAFNGSGTFTRIHNWVTDKANSVKITASRMDTEDDGFATGLSNTICRDGQSTVTANIPMNSKKFTGLAAGTTAGDSARYEQVTSAVAITGGTIAGITDLAVADGGTGASTAAGAATALGVGTGDSPQFTAVNIGHATDTTLARASAGNLSVEGNLIYRAGGTDVPVTDGGTGASTAANARTNLGLVIGTNVQAWDADLDTLASTYVAGTFTPSFTFQTVGDLGGSYTTQLGFYTRIGNRVFFDISLDFTPTHTTASGNAIIAGLPVTSANNAGAVYSVSIGQFNNVDVGASDVQVGARIAANATTITFLRILDAASAQVMSTTHFPTGVNYVIHISGSYPV